MSSSAEGQTRPQMTRLTVRAGQPSEACVIGDLAERAYDADGLLANADYRAEVSDGEARFAQGDVLVAEAGGQIVGSIVLLRQGVPLADMAGDGEVELRLLAVDPAWRRQGIGRRLMREAIESSRQDGAKAVVLYAADWSNAHALYESLGFERVPARDWLVEPGWLRAYSHPL